MRNALEKAAKTAQIIHNHSLWMMPNIYPAIAVKGSQCRLVSSPRGTLSEYALNRSKWLKKGVWIFGQRDVLKTSVCLHATSEIEYREIRQKGLRPAVSIIPNGVEIPLERKRLKPKSDFRQLLFLSRIHPKKGIDLLLCAWARVENQFPDWELHIVGPDNGGYLSQMQVLANDLNVKRVIFSGPVYGDEKDRTYFSADLYVLPTHSENFGLTVAEALAHGVPAIVTKGAPWSGLETNNCGWWIDIGKESLTECLREAMLKTDNELLTMGEQGRAWMKRDFSWKQIGEMMHKTYEWVLGGGQPPKWVVTD
jgi:glycosyltransferase involved in cell wall biosynthesis